MPIYEYECLECRKRFERRQSINDEPIRECECGGAARRVLHPVGIIFKGSGFYATDNRKPHYGEGSKSSDAPKGDGEKPPVTAKTESKEDSKPVTKGPKEETKVGAGSTASPD